MSNESINTINEVYAKLIRTGRKTLDEVPTENRIAVEKILQGKA